MYRSRMELSESFSPSTLMKIDVNSRLSENFLSTAASNFWNYLIRSGGVDFCVSPTSWLKLSPQSRSVPINPIIAVGDVSIIPISLPMLAGVLPLTPVLLNHCGVLDIHATPDDRHYVQNNSFFTGIRSVCGVKIITTIPGFIRGGNTGMVGLLYYLLLKNSVASASNCFKIAFKIALCVTLVFWV